MLTKEKIPENWILGTIEDVSIYVQRGKSPKYVEKSRIPIVNQKCIRWGRIDEIHCKFLDESMLPKIGEDRFLRDRDILWNSTGTGTIGRAATYKGFSAFPKVVADSHVTIIRVNYFVSEFLYYWIMSPNIQSKIERMQAGSTNQVELGSQAILNTQLPIPSAIEQNQIVSVIEELFSDLDNSIENLKKAQEQLKVYRQVVLKSGLEGNLTERWRKKHNEEISRWGQDNYLRTIDKYSTNGKKIKEKEYLLDAELPVVDQGQKLVGGYTDRLDCRMGCDLPVIVFGDHTKIVKLINFEFAPGADGVKVMKPDSRFRVKLFYYFTLFLAKTLPDKGYARHFQYFKDISVPIPSGEEQDEIIKEIESRFSVCDKLEETIESSLKQAESLRQSILKQAFEGKLTEQWRKEHKDLISGENSAEALLKKIKAAKEALQFKPKGKTKHD